MKNIMAASLSRKQFKQKIVKSKKVYNRKKQKPVR